MFGLTDERKLGLAAIGSGLSQLAVGQPVNMQGSPAAQMLQQRQQATILKESGLLDRFSPEQRAILAQMPAAAAQKIIAGEAFRQPAAPTQGKVVGDRLVNPVTGAVIADFSSEAPAEPIVINGRLVNPITGEVMGNYSDPIEQPDNVRIITGEDAAGMGLDPSKAYEVTTDPAGNLKNVSGVGAGDTNVSVDLGDQLSPGREAVDKAFADTYIKWTTGGGADAANQAAQIGSVLGQLEAGEQLTGPQVGLIPDFARAIVNPEAKDAQERVESVVQRSLRETLGAQFTEKEGERLIKRAYNPTLPPEVNARRLRALFTQLEAAAQSKQAMVDYFGKNGTLMGYDGPSLPSIADFEAAVSAVPTPEDTPTSGGMPSDFSSKYGGIAESQGITIQQLWEAWPNK